MPPPKLELPGFEKSGGENASHMDLGGGRAYIYIYWCIMTVYLSLYSTFEVGTIYHNFKVQRKERPDT